MEIKIFLSKKIFLRYACIFTVYILLPYIALTQTPDYFFEITGNEPRIVQRLSWKSDDSVFNYELQIDKEENNTYRTIFREKTARSFFIVSLEPGKYRYRVTPFDFLEKPGAASEWKSIEVIKALKPVLYDTGAEISHDDGEYTITVFGENIDVDAQIYLMDSSETKLYPDNKIIPKDNSYAQLFFNDEILAIGEYSIFIINPGGYQTGKSGINIEQIISEELLALEETEDEDTEKLSKTEDPVEDTETEDIDKPKNYVFIKPAAFLNVSVGWIPIIPIYGDQENNKLIDRGITIRFAVTSEHRKPLDFGVEYASSWHMNNETSKNYDIAIDFNLLARRWIANNHVAVTFRTGAGMIMFSGDARQSGDVLHTNIGISFLFLLSKHIFFEMGAEHAHLFTNPAAGVLRPCFSLGLQY
jgi:hypothetical protein